MIALCGVVIFLSCHKSNRSTSSAAGCKLTGIHVKGNGWEGNYVISYNGDGKLAAVQYADNGSSYTRNFTYSGNMIISTTVSGPTFIDTVFLGVNGDVDHIVMYSSNSGATDSFSYDGNRQLAKSVFTPTGGGATTSTYQYDNGDLVTADQTNLHIAYTYYTDKASAAGDLLALGQWVQYGTIYEKSRHLTKSETSGNVTLNITYEFDAQGKITSATEISGSETTTFTYTYTCS